MIKKTRKRLNFNNLDGLMLDVQRYFDFRGYAMRITKHSLYKDSGEMRLVVHAQTGVHRFCIDSMYGELVHAAFNIITDTIKDKL